MKCWSLAIIDIIEKIGQEQVIVSVNDTGEGIPQKILPKLFLKFSVSNSTTGTGLGLYISRILSKHMIVGYGSIIFK